MTVNKSQKENKNKQKIRDRNETQRQALPLSYHIHLSLFLIGQSCIGYDVFYLILSGIPDLELLNFPINDLLRAALVLKTRIRSSFAVNTYESFPTI